MGPASAVGPPSIATVGRLAATRSASYAMQKSHVAHLHCMHIAATPTDASQTNEHASYGRSLRMPRLHGTRGPASDRSVSAVPPSAAPSSATTPAVGDAHQAHPLHLHIEQWMPAAAS